MHEMTRISVPVTIEERQALQILAQRDLRHPREQARWMLRQALGLAPDAATPKAAHCEGSVEDRVSGPRGINVTIITDSRGRYTDFANEAYDRDEDMPDINTVDPQIADFDMFLDDSEIVQDASGTFVYKVPTNQGNRPRTPKAEFRIGGPREWMPSAYLARPTPSKARLLIKLLNKYWQSPESLRWLLLRQMADDIYLTLAHDDRRRFLDRIRRIELGTKRFEARLPNMTVVLFRKWLISEQADIFDGHTLDFTIDNDIQIDAQLIAVVGQTGSRLHVNMFSLWARQIDTQTVLVDWEEMQGDGRWAERFDVWMTQRFNANAGPIAPIHAVVSLDNPELDKRRMVNAWFAAKRAGAKQIDFCRERGIGTRKLQRWVKDVVKSG